MSLNPKVKTVINDKKLKSFAESTGKIKNSYALIGLFSDDRHAENNLYLASIGAINDFGSKDGRIPERPWMRGWFDSNTSNIKEQLLKQYRRIELGNFDVKKAIEVIGEWGANELKRSITDLNTPPNAAYTIKKKKSSNPLIDTGQMRESIHSQVVMEANHIPPEGSN